MKILGLAAMVTYRRYYHVGCDLSEALPVSYALYAAAASDAGRANGGYWVERGQG